MHDVDADRTLYLLRHAKSSWDDPTLADHDRPLAARGRRAADTIAGHIRAEGIAPELVLCSPALRTRQTLELVSDGFTEASAEIVYEPALYGASASELMARLRGVAAEVGSVMLIGHQPALQDLALGLVGAGPGLERLSGKFPTAALATFALTGPWAELSPGSARLLDIVKPKQLQS